MKRKSGVFIIFAAFLAVALSLGCIANANVAVDTSEGLAYAFDANEEYVRLGGVPIGISVATNGLIYIDRTRVPIEGGEAFPLENADLKKGDVLEKFNGIALNSVHELQKYLASFGEDEITLTFVRNGVRFDVKTHAAIDVTGKYKLGICLKEDVGGVGTLTFVKENGRFGALGHRIADVESGLDFELNSGKLFDVTVESVTRGESGKPGGLNAAFNRFSTPIGTVDNNTDIGVYGDYTADYDGQLIKTAHKGEARMGHAQICATVEGNTPKYYDIDIVKVVTQTHSQGKGFVINVTDYELLEKTGGIVQGMSGSPIVQDGVLVGAVTHVFIADPTRGYGVHIGFMLEESEKTRVDDIAERDAA